MKLYTAAEAAEAIGTTDANVRRLAREQGIGRRHGRAWMFSEADLRRLAKRPTMGRPRKGEQKRDDG